MGGDNFPQRTWHLGGRSLGLSSPGSSHEMSVTRGNFAEMFLPGGGERVRGGLTSQCPPVSGMIFWVRGEFDYEGLPVETMSPRECVPERVAGALP